MFNCPCHANNAQFTRSSYHLLFPDGLELKFDLRAQLTLNVVSPSFDGLSFILVLLPLFNLCLMNHNALKFKVLFLAHTRSQEISLLNSLMGNSRGLLVVRG